MDVVNVIAGGRRVATAVGTVFAALVVLGFAGLPGREKPRALPELCWPAAPAPARIKFLNSFSSPQDLQFKRSSLLKALLKKIVGLEGSERSVLFPYGLTTDSRGRLIIVDTKLRLLHVFDSKKKTYFAIKPPNKERFVSPIGVAVDAADNIYVSDSYEGKVFIFDRQRNLKDVIGRPEGRFKRPTGIAIDKAARRLYVVDTLKHEVVALALDGKELFRFGKRGEGNGEFNFPTQICLRGDRVYVTDTLNARVQVFDIEGKFVSAFGRLGRGAGAFDKPKGVALDSEGHIYVVEGLHDVVQIYDQQGRFLLAFGATGRDFGEFFLPTGIHIDEQDNIYVADSYNRRIQVFKYLRQPGG